MRFAIFLCFLPLVAQEAEGLRLEKVFANYRFTDGPAWSPEHFLIYFDVPANRMIRWNPGKKPEIFRENTGGASGAAYDAQGRLYICESRARRVVRMDKRGKIEIMAERFNGKRFNAPNDITLRKDGNAYFTDPAFGEQADSRELDFYGVFHVGPKGELDVVARLRTRPNGIALSANGKTLYVADADERAIRVWDLDNKGAAINERVLVQKIEGVPAGIRTDEKGNIYVAAKAIEVFSAEGKPVQTIPIAEKPSNLTFGDPDLQTLYITARTAVYRMRLDVKGTVAYQP